MKEHRSGLDFPSTFCGIPRAPARGSYTDRSNQPAPVAVCLTTNSSAVELAISGTPELLAEMGRENHPGPRHFPEATPTRPSRASRPGRVRRQGVELLARVALVQQERGARVQNCSELPVFFMISPAMAEDRVPLQGNDQGRLNLIRKKKQNQDFE